MSIQSRLCEVSNVGPTRTATSTMWLTRSALERSMGSVWSTSLAGPVRR